jgi:hypothetical protein
MARWQDYKMARLQDYKIARLQDYRITRLQDCKIKEERGGRSEGAVAGGRSREKIDD